VAHRCLEARRRLLLPLLLWKPSTDVMMVVVVVVWTLTITGAVSGRPSVHRCSTRRDDTYGNSESQRRPVQLTTPCTKRRVGHGHLHTDRGSVGKATIRFGDPQSLVDWHNGLWLLTAY